MRTWVTVALVLLAACGSGRRRLAEIAPTEPPHTEPPSRETPLTESLTNEAQADVGPVLAIRGVRLTSSAEALAALAALAEEGEDVLDHPLLGRRGILTVRNGRSSCQSFVTVFAGAFLRFECDPSITRCVGAYRAAPTHGVYLFSRARDDTRILFATVYYEGALPGEEPSEISAVLGQREETCALHDAVLSTDDSLVGDSFWTVASPSSHEADELVTRHCGVEARETAREVLWEWADTPLVCSSLRCGFLETGFHRASLLAEHDREGRLRLRALVSVASGDGTMPEFEDAMRRMEEDSCPDQRIRGS
jgi:hypothetical protein